MTATQPALKRAPLHEVRSQIFDSARWAPYRPRPDDIVVATYPKCGTTWTQRIVEMLLKGNAEPTPLLIPWYDMRLYGPVEGMHANAESWTTRRQLKTHLPYDALPVFAGMKFIHVARDGRDAAMSFHNHKLGTKPEARERFNAILLADPKFGFELPPVPEDPAEFFRDWLEDGGADGDERCSYFYMENSYWAVRRDPDMLLVHYNDLKADRDGEIRRIAAFLGIAHPETLMKEIVSAAAFEQMQEQAERLMPMAEMTWDGGAKRFLYKGTNRRWEGVVAEAELDRYQSRVRDEFSPSLAAWLEHGRLIAGDPADAPN
jgi:aryl sulfotransferase